MLFIMLDSTHNDVSVYNIQGATVVSFGILALSVTIKPLLIATFVQFIMMNSLHSCLWRCEKALGCQHVVRGLGVRPEPP